MVVSHFCTKDPYTHLDLSTTEVTSMLSQTLHYGQSSMLCNTANQNINSYFLKIALLDLTHCSAEGPSDSIWHD